MGAIFLQRLQTNLRLQTGPQNLGMQWCCNQPRDGTPAHAAGGPRGGVSPVPRPAPPCLRPTWQGAPTWSKETSQQMLRPGNWWVTSPIFTPGKDSCTRQAVTGLLLEKNCWLRHDRDTCEPNWSKTLCKIGGSELPAHRGCDDFSCRV